uniref:Uncharacterized protein n=1 Tax=Onchocerca volvulus TaxID=6282 RepID=A0A8R1TLB2_ONCVO
MSAEETFERPEDDKHPTYHEQSTLVEYFRLQELQDMCMQIAFGNAIASIRITINTVKTLVLRIIGELGFFQLTLVCL